MPRYKLLLIFMLIILLLFTLIRSDYFTSSLKQLTGSSDETTSLPPWLSRAHRLSGPYAFEYIPLDPEELSPPEDPAGADDKAPASGGAYVNPSGSPYPPGTLADMIWQQKQQDQRYGN
jgi:hypothetical protein